MRRILVTLALLLLLAVLLAGVARPVKNFLAQDRCLDSGGRWNARAQSCEGATAP